MEIAVAVGILSVSLVSILGLVPVGLSGLRLAMEQTSESQILQRISAQTLLTPYSQLSSVLDGKTFYYDDNGMFLASAPDNPPADTRFSVTTKLVSSVYPGVTDDTTTQGSIQAVQIEITEAASTAARVKKVSNYVVQVPNCGN